jgi:hypothetical protein
MRRGVHPVIRGADTALSITYWGQKYVLKNDYYVQGLRALERYDGCLFSADTIITALQYTWKITYCMVRL